MCMVTQIKLKSIPLTSANRCQAHLTSVSFEEVESFKLFCNYFLANIVYGLLSSYMYL